MARLKRSDKGFTLLELVIAVALSAVVLLSASNLLIHFGRFSTNVVRSEASLTGTTLGAFEEMVERIKASNFVFIPVMPPPAPLESALWVYNDVLIPAAGVTPAHYTPANNFESLADLSDDTGFAYWLGGGGLWRWNPTTIPPSATRIANGILTLRFTQPAPNSVRIVLEAQAASGSLGEMTTERLETTVTMRSRRAAA